MEPEGPDVVDRVPPIVGLFVRQLLVANKAVGLYPPGSTIPREAAEETVRILDDVLERYAEVSLTVSRDGLYFDELQVFPGQPAFAAFAVELYHRRLAAVRFHAGVTYRDILAFLTIMKDTPEELAAGGGFEARLWDQGVGAITVAETQVSVIDAPANPPEPDAEAPEAAPAPVARRKREPAPPPRLRDRIEIAHVVGDPGAAREYLDAPRNLEGVELGLAGTARRFSQIGRLALEVDPAEADSLVQSLAEALWELDPELRGRVLVERVLPEARESAPLAAAVHKLDLVDVCRMLAAGVADEDTRRDGLARALRNLAQISQVGRGQFTRAAETALAESGMSQSDARGVIARALPERLSVRRIGSAPVSLDAPAEAILRLLDEAPGGGGSLAEDPATSALAAEAQRGIRDGDIIEALITLVTLDTRSAQFASMMAALEDQLGVLVTRGEVDAAADAALALLAAAKDPALAPEQQRRLEQAVRRFARPEDIRTLTQALWTFRPGEPEHEAARRLLETLGPIAIPAILEQLADEPDRGIRKALVDLLSHDASHYIPQIGANITDSRWYFVRNVVAILGSTHSSAILPYVERTLRHQDERVRRESIRAVSSVADRRALDLLGSSLGDDDAQNVQLAARYLGLRGERIVVPALEVVARGESRGNRETGPRVEAIEALGRIGAPEALPTLQALANKRSLLGAGRYREIRAAASAAMAAIRMTAGGGGPT